MVLEKSNLFYKENRSKVLNSNRNNYKIPKNILYVKSDNFAEGSAYLIEYNNMLYHDNGCFRKGVYKYDVINVLDFEETVRHLDINSKRLFKSIRNFYFELVLQVKNNLIKDIDKTDKKEDDILELLNISKAFNFLECSNFETKENKRNIEDIIKDGLTSLKLVIEFYCSNYNKELNSLDYLKPFKPLAGRFGINNNIINSYKKFRLYTGKVNEYSCVKLCLDLETGELVTRYFDVSMRRWYKGFIPYGEEGIKYVTVGLLPVDYLWSNFIKGDKGTFKAVKMYLEMLSTLANDEIFNCNFEFSIISYLNDDIKIRNYEDDTDLTDKDKELLNNYLVCLDKFNKNKTSENVSEYTKNLINAINLVLDNSKVIKNALLDNNEFKDKSDFVKLVKLYKCNNM